MKENWGRWMVLFTLATGIIFHSTRLIIGVDAFQEIFTATVDAIFTIPIVFGIIGMVSTWRYFQFRGRIEKGIVIFSLVYFTLTMPLHCKHGSQVTQTILPPFLGGIASSSLVIVPCCYFYGHG